MHSGHRDFFELAEFSGRVEGNEHEKTENFSRVRIRKISIRPIDDLHRSFRGS